MKNPPEEALNCPKLYGQYKKPLEGRIFNN